MNIRIPHFENLSFLNNTVHVCLHFFPFLVVRKRWVFKHHFFSAICKCFHFSERIIMSPSHTLSSCPYEMPPPRSTCVGFHWHPQPTASGGSQVPACLTLGFPSHNYKVMNFATTNLLLQGQAALRGKSITCLHSFMPTLKIRMLIFRDPSAPAGQAGADGALWPCPLTCTVAPWWPNPTPDRKLKPLQLAPCCWNARSSAELHYQWLLLLLPPA